MHRPSKIKAAVVLSISLCAALVLLQGRSVEKAVANDGPESCDIRMTRGTYGFQCHGYSNVGSGLEPVTFVGTLRGDGRGLFEGYGTFNSSTGSASTHVKGTGNLSAQCFGHVRYGINEVLFPGGGTYPLAPIAFDYTAVSGGKEILGTAVAEPEGGVGSSVPRLTCRLVDTRR